MALAPALGVRKSRASLGRCPLLFISACWKCHSVIQADGAGGARNWARRNVGYSLSLKVQGGFFGGGVFGG